MVPVTSNGAGDGNTDTADDGLDTAAHDDQKSPSKIQARARRKGRRKRRRKSTTKVAAESPSSTEDGQDLSETLVDSKKVAQKSETLGNGDKTAGSAEESALSDSTSSSSNPSDSTEAIDDPNALAESESDDATQVESAQDKSEQTAEAEDTDGGVAEADTDDSTENRKDTEGDDAAKGDSDPEVTTDDAAKDKQENNVDSDSASSDSSEVDTEEETAADDTEKSSAPTETVSEETVAEETAVDVTADSDDTDSASVENVAAKATDRKTSSVDTGDEQSGNALDGAYSTKKNVRADDKSSTDTKTSGGKPLAGERIDDLLSLVELEPEESDAANDDNLAEESAPPNIDDLFVGAVDKSETDSPAIDDVLDDSSDDAPSDEVDDEPGTAESSEDATEILEVAPTEELEEASEKTAATDKPADELSAGDEESTDTSENEQASPVIVVPSPPAEADSVTATKTDDTAKAKEPGQTEPDAVVAEVSKPARPADAVPGLVVAPAEAPPSTPVTPPSEPAPTGELATAPQAKSRRSGLRLLKWVAVLAVVGYALLVAVWGISVLSQQDKVASGVQVGQLAAGGMTRDSFSEAVDELQNDLSTEGLEVVVDQEVIDTNPAAMGVQIDKEKLVSDAFAARRGGFVLLRPFTWLGQLGSTEQVAIPYIFDSSKAAATTDLAIIPRLESPVEPAFKFVGTNLSATEGTSGITVDLDEIDDLLPPTIEAGTPYRMELNPTTANPTVETELVDEIAAEINGLTEDKINIRILNDEIEVEPKTMREWALLDLDGDNTSWSFDNDLMIADLKPRFPTLGNEDQQARIEVVDGTPTIINASETVICCEDGVDTLLLEALEADPPKAPEPDEDEEEDPEAEEVAPPLRTAVFRPEIVGFDEGVAELESLGINEQVSTFTTKHPCCANRVKNIQRFAELMQGTIVRPGESLSLNDTVGRRTTAKGFFSDGAIVNGELKKSVGGGVSQYATTFLNAAFYSGVDITEYRSHSRYISRYPEGREATINFPSIDLEIYNDTDYGILVWNEWTSKSITVSFYSTKNAEVTDLPTRTTWNGQCRTVTTPRLVEYLDESKPDKEDEVFGYYFPGFNKRCDGSLINPPDDDE